MPSSKESASGRPWYHQSLTLLKLPLGYLLVGCLLAGATFVSGGCWSANEKAPQASPGASSEKPSQASTVAQTSLPKASPQGIPAPQDASQSLTEAPSEGLLTDVTQALGLPAAGTWPDGLYMTPEITPGGVGLIDFDQDGDLDIYQVCHSPPAQMPESFKAPAPNRLFRQESDGTFKQVPDAAGLADAGYGHGCAMGDIDNDGDVDVFVTNYGPNTLYLNQGGKFVNVTEKAGISGDHWSSATAFFDYDRDGYLDLFVVHFGVFDATRRCGVTGTESKPDYCGPHLFDGVRDQLYHNNGDGTFTDVSEQAGITSPARGWGVICADITGDGLPDIYVCNDEEPNQLWVNGGDGTFYDEAMLMGAALNGSGRVEASMGVTLGDVNSDGFQDLFMTHVASETNTLYTLTGDGLFGDSSSGSGMAGVDLPYTGWGCGLLDLDHDGDLDLAVANGRVAVGTPLPSASLGTYWNRYAEPNLLFINDGSGQFKPAGSEAGSFSQRPGLTRGLAVGDLDNDGDLDLVSNSINNHLVVYRNDAPPKENNWLQCRVLTSGRDAIGAQLTLVNGGSRQVRTMLRSYSYLASNDPRVHFGLGSGANVDRLEVKWPDGKQETFAVDAVNRVVTLKQGEGSASDAQ